MKIYHTDCFSDFSHHDSSVAIGNFDGVHRGHAHIVSLSKRYSHFRFFGAITFDPHPRDFFLRATIPFHLTSFEQKNNLLQSLELDFVWHQSFDTLFSQMSPEAFVRDFLIRDLRVGHVVVGPDFVFGHNRQGNTQTLKMLGDHLGLGVTIAPTFVAEDTTICSSSSIRRMIRSGHMDQAMHMLGRPFSIKGTIISGDQRGRTLGFPTANVDMGSSIRPLHGVYAVRAHLKGEIYDGVCNIGRRPTVNGTHELMEVHLFDFRNEIYGETIDVFFHSFLRPEKKFPSLQDLKTCIERDCLTAKLRLNA